MIKAKKGGIRLNQVGLVGRLTKDPILRGFSENRIATNFVLAVNRNYRNLNGEIDTDFILCTAWGTLAESVYRYCGKGSLIGIKGRLQTRSYTNKENVKVYTTEVVADDVRFYILKSRTDQRNEAPPEVTKHFVLPETEAELPIT